MSHSQKFCMRNSLIKIICIHHMIFQENIQKLYNVYFHASKITKHHQILHIATSSIYQKFDRTEKFLCGAAFDLQLIYKILSRPPFDQIFSPFLIGNVKKLSVKTTLLIFVDFAPSRFSRNKFEQATQPFHAESGHTQATYASKIWFQKYKQSHLKEHKILRTNIF